jgi:hypothetical protein
MNRESLENFIGAPKGSFAKHLQDQQAKDESENRLAGMPCSQRFKIIGNYLYPPIESSKSFDSKEAARDENLKWTKEAAAKGMIWRGRVVPVENKLL